MQITTEMRSEQRERPAQAGPVMYQKWRDLLFLHWECDPQEIQKTLPPGLSVDTFDGRAYVGLVPFAMRAIRPRGLPALPWISNFLEINLRTYVYDARGVPGVWFYSLDASGRVAVAAARAFFGLPYYHAKMRIAKTIVRAEGNGSGVEGKNAGGEGSSSEAEVSYWHRRAGSPRTQSSFFRYRPSGPGFEASPGTLEFFLVERYVLFTQWKGRLWEGRVHHRPYPVRQVEVHEWDDCLFALDGLPQPSRPPDHALFSPGVDVDVFAVKAVK